MISVTNIIFASVMAVLGFLAGLPCCTILNKIPAEWLCDYDETPSEELKSGQRFKFSKHGVIVGAALAVTFAAPVLSGGITVEYFIEVCMFFVLALVAAADAKYTIIPDQFTIAAAVIAVIFAVVDILTVQQYMSKWYEPLIGIAAGAGVLIILDLFSMLVLKKEGFGFGDIKLMVALGMMFGWKYTVVMLMAASFIAAIHFLILIFSGKGFGKEGIYLPMGPYRCIGAAVTVICQPWLNPLLEMYKTVLPMEALH